VLTYLIIFLQELSSEERFHVELHFSPGAKGCEEDKNLPAGYGYRPASREVIIMPFLKAKIRVSGCGHTRKKHQEIVR